MSPRGRKSGARHRLVDVTDLQQSFLSALEDMRYFCGKGLPGYHYQGIGDFVLREGRFFEPQPLPSGVRRRPIQQCFRNALRTTMNTGLSYVEGYALLIDSTSPLLHAWNASSDGFAVDTTWEPVGRIYLGVSFPLSLVRRPKGFLLSVLDDWQRGWPILREPFGQRGTT
jgi:hypothetical protein